MSHPPQHAPSAPHTISDYLPYDGIYDEPVDSEERLHRDVDAAWIVFTSALLSPLVGAARVAIWDPRKN